MKNTFSNRYQYVLFTAVLLAMAGLIFFHNTRSMYESPVSGEPVATTTVSQTVDTTLGQYNERPSAPTAATSSISVAPVEGCGLTFSFTPQSSVVASGGRENYSLLVHNRGSATCHNVSFSVYYSDNESFVSATPHPTASDYYWSLGDMSPGKSSFISLVTSEHLVSAPYQIANEACATADNSPDVCPENLVFVGTQGAAQAIVSATASTPATKLSPILGEYGVWVWQSPAQMSPDYRTQIVSAMKQNNFNAVYVTIEDYIDIVSLPAGSDKDAKTASYMKSLSDFVTSAHTAGVAVDVEGGERDWADTDNRWKGYALIDFVSAYNTAYPNAKVRALQYDVESYLLPEYNDNKAEVLSDFVAFVDGSVQRMKNVDANLSVVIPHFYDDTQAWTPSFVYNGKDAYTFTHLLDVLEQKPGSTMTIMAYRNFFPGDDGVEDLVTPEMTEASSDSYHTKIIVAQETGDVSPSYVTFHGMKLSDLIGSLNTIQDVFGTYASFGGVAVHYLDPFLQLK